ncbi:MAG: hypothetical protein DI603_16350 [Roseateles depolymerans]|uniref:Periplasmic heavy metal sensor n=1 Tax=Roseateles depolymerans TaxID=76731 RepID=A0A2W5DGL3_9BURK|nr:MAG: hypothetical protein DI603_16350 [Roseateles depolymerans]
MRLLLAVLALTLAPGAFAQHAGHAHQAGGYAGMQNRDIKALSDEQVADLREGRDMGASLPAELNGVPGPMHVLQLASQLGVSPEQRQSIERITSDMKTKAQALGAQVIEAESNLDRAFRTMTADEPGIEAATARIAASQAQLRAVHLVAHLQTRRLLTDQQVAAYNQARGYAAAN